MERERVEEMDRRVRGGAVADRRRVRRVAQTSRAGPWSLLWVYTFFAGRVTLSEG